MTRVVVVGGGVGGLVAARDLAKNGVEVTLVEASDRLGGMVQRHTVGGIDLDMAADSFATRGDVVATLAIQIGLGADVVTPDPRGAWLVTRSGDAHPLPAAGLLGIPSTPMAADVIAVVGTAAAFRAELDAMLPGPVGAKARTLGELVRRRMGSGVLDALVVPIAAGVHSTHPDELELDRVAPGLRHALLRDGSLARAVQSLRAAAPAGSAVAGIRGGIVRIVDELVADLATYGVDVRLGTRAVRIDADGVDVAPTHDGTGPERLVADHVLSGIADPARSPLAPKGPRPAGIELVTLVVDRPELDAAPRGTGLLVHPGATGIGAKALTHATVKWPWLAERAAGRHVLRLSYAVPAGEAGDPADATTHADGTTHAGGAGISVALDPAAERTRRAVADASALLDVPIDPDADVLGAARVRWTAPATGAADLPEGVTGIGEANVGRGLAGIVGASRRAAERILDA